MGQKISGYDVNLMVGAYAVTFDEVTLSIEDGTAATNSKNRPNGFVRGALAAIGEIKLDTDNLNYLLEAAKTAGSWQQLDPFDLVMNAETNDAGLNIEAFECVLKISDLLEAKSKGEEKLMHTLPYFVSGKEFVNINGVPYAPTADIELMR